LFGSVSIGLGGLEVLELRNMGQIPIPHTILPYMRGLQLLSVRTSDEYVLSVAQETIHRCARSLKSVLWDCWRGDTECRYIDHNHCIPMTDPDIFQLSLSSIWTAL
jgi:hypothetical protein